MDFATTIDVGKNIRKHKAIGVVGKNFLLNKLTEIYTNPQLKHMNTYWDLSNADLTSLTIEDIVEVAGYVKQHWPSSSPQKASIVAPDICVNLIARKYAKQFDDLKSSAVMVFENEEEALRWLE